MKVGLPDAFQLKKPSSGAMSSPFHLFKSLRSHTTTQQLYALQGVMVLPMQLNWLHSVSATAHWTWRGGNRFRCTMACLPSCLLPLQDWLGLNSIFLLLLNCNCKWGLRECHPQIRYKGVCYAVCMSWWHVCFNELKALNNWSIFLEIHFNLYFLALFWFSSVFCVCLAKPGNWWQNHY